MTQTIREAFPQWLRERLRGQGWIVSDFAEQVGVRPAAVYRWTAGQRTPTDAQIERIAEVLQVCADEIWQELARDGIGPIGAPLRVSERPPLTRPALRASNGDGHFACWLRSQLTERGWTAGTLARSAGLDVVTVRAWLSGVRTPASVQFPVLASTFGLDVDAVRQAAKDGDG
jgi:transcriptional regulator with XRE-family HTH domain